MQTRHLFMGSEALFILGGSEEEGVLKKQEEF